MAEDFLPINLCSMSRKVCLSLGSGTVCKCRLVMQSVISDGSLVGTATSQQTVDVARSKANGNVVFQSVLFLSHIIL